MINVMTNFKILTGYFEEYQFNIFFCLARARSLALTSWSGHSLICPTMRCGIFINPVLFRPTHTFSSRYLARGPGLIKAAGLWTIAKRLGPVLFSAWIPLVNNHFDRHLTAPYAAFTPGFISTCIKLPMPPLPIRRQLRRNTKPRRRFPLFFHLTFQNLQLTDLIKLNRLCSAISNRR